MPPRRRCAQHVFSVAVGLLGLGVVAAFNIQVGYSQPGTPLYQPDAQVNIDAGAIGQKVFRRQRVMFSTPPFPHIQSVLAPNVLRLADHLRGFLLTDPSLTQVISFASAVISPFN